MKPKMAVVCVIRTHLFFALNMAKLVTGDFEIVFVLDPVTDWQETDMDRVRQTGFSVQLAPLSRLLRRSQLWLSRRRGFTPLSRFIHYLSARNFSHFILHQIHPSIIVTCIDTAYSNLKVVKDANRRGVHTVVIPFALANHEGLLRAAQGKPAQIVKKEAFLKRAFVALFPHWARTRNSVTYLAKGFWEAATAEFFGIAPPEPWTIVGGRSRHIIVESAFIREYFTASGAVTAKMKIASLLTYPSSPGSFNDERLKLLFSVPPDHFNDQVFPSHDDMVRFIAHELSLVKNAHVVVSAHPRLNAVHITDLIEPYGLKLDARPIEQLISECDIFVASSSATIRIALSYRKIVLNFDMYRLGYTEYLRLGMVSTVFSREEFIRTCSEITRSKESRDRLYRQFEEYPSDYFMAQAPTLAQVLKDIIAS